MKNKKERHCLVQCDGGNIGEVLESALLSGEITACPVCTGEIEKPICTEGGEIMVKEEHREFECRAVFYEDGSYDEMCENCSENYYKDVDDPDYDDTAPDPQYTEYVADIDSLSIDVFDDDPIPTCNDCGCELEEV